MRCSEESLLRVVGVLQFLSRLQIILCLSCTSVSMSGAFAFCRTENEQNNAGGSCCCFEDTGLSTPPSLSSGIE
ncbi:unnamed protein product [Amoebophrya sp. A120]|nr:unnamed protein product [Amoebophrya sp. A120]|eukprot:GSA120T00021491001.1